MNLPSTWSLLMQFQTNSLFDRLSLISFLIFFSSFFGYWFLVAAYELLIWIIWALHLLNFYDSIACPSVSLSLLSSIHRVYFSVYCPISSGFKTVVRNFGFRFAGSEPGIHKRKGDSSWLASPLADLPNQFSASRPVHRNNLVKGMARIHIELLYRQSKSVVQIGCLQKPDRITDGFVFAGVPAAFRSSSYYRRFWEVPQPFRSFWMVEYLDSTASIKVSPKLKALGLLASAWK